MKKATLRKIDVIAYLEHKILHNEETVEELELYQDYTWNGTLEENDTYESLLNEMFAEYRGE